LVRDRPSKVLVSLDVNGQRHQVAVEPRTTLLEALRYTIGLTGSKQGCDKGDCGACTVISNGSPILSCISLAVEHQQDRITTIEGLAKGGQVHPVQDAFDLCGALQCGFCQSGMMISAAALLERNPRPTRQEIKEALAGNLCRCTGYTKILDAVEVASGQRSMPEWDPRPTTAARNE
jgi:aerobic-type carbon monoxide dehydrogenase small subunit (CoxS/CutS family)